MEPFPNVEEYDAVILNLTSLDQVLFDKVVRTRSGQISGLQAPILTLLAHGNNVYCVASYYLVPTRPAGSGQAWTTIPPSNYDWIAVKPQLQPNEGQSMSVPTEKEFEKYFSLVGKWNMEIIGLLNPQTVPRGSILDIYGSAAKELLGIPSEEPLRLSIRPLSTNKSGKMIASKVMLPRQGSGGIYLLPPTTKCSVREGIELIIDAILGPKPTDRPSWWFKVDVPQLRELESTLGEKRKETGRINVEISEIQRQIVEVQGYRDLLSEEGETLVRIVRKVLAELGILTNQTRLPHGSNRRR